MRLRIAEFAAGAMLAVGVAASAADGISSPAGPSRASTGSLNASEGRADDRIAGEFSVFAGSRDNARNLVSGLRQGSEVTLADPAASGQAGVKAVFTPPTPPMNRDNVRIALALAQELLIRLNITHPTSVQIRAALAGGTVTRGAGSTATTTRLRGVLAMRASGMAWEQVAGAMGTKLAHVMGGLKQTNQQLAAGRPVPGASAARHDVVLSAAGRGPQSAGPHVEADHETPGDGR